jgi:hypothetical protein
MPALTEVSGVLLIFMLSLRSVEDVFHAMGEVDIWNLGVREDHQSESKLGHHLNRIWQIHL